MAALSDYLENQLVDHIFRTASLSKPTNTYIALLTAAADDTGGGTEVTGGSYARVSVLSADASWNGTHGTTTGASSGTDGTIDNAIIVTFPAPTANWGLITHFAIYDASSAGNLIIHAALTTPKTVNNGDAAPSFAVGALTFQIDD